MKDIKLNNVKKIRIDELLIFNSSKNDILNYVLSRKNSEVLFLKSYEKIRDEKLEKSLLELRQKIDFLISKVKRNRTEEKIKSLEQRFDFQKNIIKKDIENKIFFYKSHIDSVSNIFDNEYLYLTYNFNLKNSDKDILLFPIKILKIEGNIYIKNCLDKNIITYNRSLQQNMSLNDESILENDFIKNIIGKNNNIDCTVFLLEIQLDESNDIKKLITDKNLVKRIENYKKYLAENIIAKEIEVLLGEKKINRAIGENDHIFTLINNREKEIIINNIMLSKILNDEKILLISNGLYMEFNFNDNIRELINKLKNIDLYNESKRILNKNICSNFTVKFVYENTRDFSNDKRAYNNYRRTLNLDGISYCLLEETLDRVAIEDVFAYREYLDFKSNIGYFNSYSNLNNLEISKIINKIELLLNISNHMNENYNFYYKKIIFKIKRKGDLLEKYDMIEISKNIVNEKNRQQIMENKVWSIANIFKSNKRKEYTKDEINKFKELENKELKILAVIYSKVETQLEDIKLINEEIFNNILNALYMENFCEEINKILQNINLARKNKLIIGKINNWSALKVAIVEYLSAFDKYKEACEFILKFKSLDTLLEIEKKEAIKINEIYDFYEKFDQKLLEEPKSLISKIINQGLSKIDDSNIEYTKEKYDLIILDDKNILDDKKVVNLIFASKKFISFRDEEITKVEKLMIGE